MRYLWPHGIWRKDIGTTMNTLRAYLTTPRLVGYASEETKEMATYADIWQGANEDGHIASHQLEDRGVDASEEAVTILRELNIPVPASRSAAEMILAHAIIERWSYGRLAVVAFCFGALLHSMPDFIALEQKLQARDAAEVEQAETFGGLFGSQKLGSA